MKCVCVCVYVVGRSVYGIDATSSRAASAPSFGRRAGARREVWMRNDEGKTWGIAQGISVCVNVQCNGG